jgi:hypothetical protein
MSMRVGIANPFAYRPHVGHMVFLARQLARLGHSTFFLSCEGALESCHSKVAKVGFRRNLECIKCRMGGLASYAVSRPARVDRPAQVSSAQIVRARQFVYSTACSTLQVEHASQTSTAQFSDLQTRSAESAAIAWSNTRRWIRDHSLDCVFVFNGRFDLTRAILEACVDESVRWVSVERSWFGEGVQLLPGESCLGLRTFHELCKRWAGRPLSYAQAVRASELIARRVNRQSIGEWKQYNLRSTARHTAREIRYLFLPSSQHEWMGHPDRNSGWTHPTDGLEFLCSRWGLNMSDVLVRGHPAWALTSKLYGPSRANEFYGNWAARVGAQYIDAASDLDTHELMRDARLILLNGSSASMQAAWLGKPLISFVPAAFTSSGISLNLVDAEAVVGMDAPAVEGVRRPDRSWIDPVTQCRLALRYIYCVNFRLMQFVDSLRSTSPYTFSVAEPHDLSGLESLVADGILQESDRTYEYDDAGERRVVDTILSGNAQSLRVDSQGQRPGRFNPIRRRMAYRLIDALTR